MRRTFPWIAPLLILIVLAQGARHACADSPREFFFKQGDRILFLGDSITEQYQYSTDIELYLTTRFPKWNLFFLNAGIGGDTAAGGAARFASHVLAEKPTAITINFGMNDAAYGKFEPTLQAKFKSSTEAMLTAAQSAGVRVALVSPNAVDRRVQERFRLYLETQQEFYAPLKSLAANHGATFVDQYATTRAALERMERDGANMVIPFGDGFHTASPGGLLMAHAILTGLDAPALVSNVAIDAASEKLTTDGCAVDQLRASSQGVAFDRMDDAIPFPVQPDWVSLLPYVNQLKDLNWCGLKVTGLEAGNYALLIDEKVVGSHTADQLAEGINLGILTTGPIYDQGKKVLDAINAKNKIVHQRFRGVVMYNAPDWLADVAAERKPQELVKRMDLITARQAEIHQLAQPVKHHFELKPIN